MYQKWRAIEMLPLLSYIPYGSKLPIKEQHILHKEIALPIE